MLVGQTLTCSRCAGVWQAMRTISKSWRMAVRGPDGWASVCWAMRTISKSWRMAVRDSYSHYLRRGTQHDGGPSAELLPLCRRLLGHEDKLQACLAVRGPTSTTCTVECSMKKGRGGKS